MNSQVSDFGCAKPIAPDDTQSHTAAGTRLWWAPEVLAYYYTSKCDLWSFGWEVAKICAAGRPPISFKLEGEAKEWFSLCKLQPTHETEVKVGW